MSEFSIDAATRDELRGKLVDLLSEYATVLSNGCELPMLGDWVLVVTYDDAADAGRATQFKLAAYNQWSHRTVGLLVTAADDYREISHEPGDE